MNLPLGYDHFGQIRRLGLTLVDKTLLIKDLIDNVHTQVSLIIRPRRFGKSLNLSMIHHFFADKVFGFETKGLFENLKIAECGDTYMRQQGQYPVIMLSFKDIKEPNFEETYECIWALLKRTFGEHEYLRNSEKLSLSQKQDFAAMFHEDPPRNLVKNALLNLSTYLFAHHKKPVILLIDEYDTPIQSGYLYGYYDEVFGFFRHLFSGALKTNPYLHQAVLTGILRVSKESLFSGLNNIDVYSMFRSEYSEYFGFTEPEVADLLKQSKLSLTLEQVRYWYNGYQIGAATVYNPWSIVNCLNGGGSLKPYWVGTSGNEVIKNAIAQTSSDFKIHIESLLQGQSVEKLVDENFIFADLQQDESAIWSLLLASGYLKAIRAVPEGSQMLCQLLVPNFEVMCVYEEIFKKWFSQKMGQGGYQNFLANLLDGNILDFTRRLRDFLFENASYFDVKGLHPEKFYHGFVLGLIASLQNTHLIKSNRESGYGRYDVIIIPKDKSQRGIILEFKRAEPNEDLDTVAKEALQQIKDKQYAVELTQAGISTILKLGLAFKGKEVAVVYE